MTATAAELRTLVVEREFAHPPERLWRALTQSDLLAEWIMPNDFRAEVGERFEMMAEWGKVEGEVLAIEPLRSLDGADRFPARRKDGVLRCAGGLAALPQVAR